jgi:hypothetical protein
MQGNSGWDNISTKKKNRNEKYLQEFYKKLIIIIL